MVKNYAITSKSPAVIGYQIWKRVGAALFGFTAAFNITDLNLRVCIIVDKKEYLVCSNTIACFLAIRAHNPLCTEDTYGTVCHTDINKNTSTWQLTDSWQLIWQKDIHHNDRWKHI